MFNDYSEAHCVPSFLHKTKQINSLKPVLPTPPPPLTTTNYLRSALFYFKSLSVNKSFSFMLRRQPSSLLYRFQCIFINASNVLGCNPK